MMQYFQVAYRDWADIHGIFGRLSAELRTSTLPPKNAPCPYISEVLRGARIYSYHRTQIQEDQPIRSPVYWPNFVWNHASHWRALPRQKGKDKLYTLLLNFPKQTVAILQPNLKQENVLKKREICNEWNIFRTKNAEPCWTMCVSFLTCSCLKQQQIVLKNDKIGWAFHQIYKVFKKMMEILTD